MKKNNKPFKNYNSNIYSLRSFKSNLSLICYISIQLSIQFAAHTVAFSADRVDKPEVDWAANGEIDFCPNSSQFDFRNAYWLGALSHYSYWEPSYSDQLIRPKKETSLSIPFEKTKTNKSSPNSKKDTTPMNTKSLGFGTLFASHFTSSVPKPEDKKVFSNRYHRWLRPLPETACILPEFKKCFSIVPGARLHNSSLNIECGLDNANAYISELRLKNIQLLVTGKSLSEPHRAQAIADKKRIELEITNYEKSLTSPNTKKLNNTKLPVIELDWKDPSTINRCSTYVQKWDFKPDTQASLYENEDALFITIRGTEPGNNIDLNTDFFSTKKVNLENIKDFYLSEPNPSIRNELIENSFFTSNMKGSVHEGFFRATDILGQWLLSQLDTVRTQHPNAASKPLFITGHSLGGAIGHIILYNLMKINKNNLSNKNFTPYNIKALYTFGAPRVGNELWATDMKKLADEQGVGIYSLVNENDLVAHAPCLNYSHVGAHIHMGAKSSTTTTEQSEHGSCAFMTALLKPHRFSEMLQDHYMTSYYYNLSIKRSELNTKLNQAKSLAIISGNKLASQQLSYPENCSRSSATPKLEGPLANNYRKLTNSIESNSTSN